MLFDVLWHETVSWGIDEHYSTFVHLKAEENCVFYRTLKFIARDELENFKLYCLIEKLFSMFCSEISLFVFTCKLIVQI